MQSFTLTYTAGAFGVDDTGSIKIGFRFATDFGPVQFTDPKAPGYTTVEASNGATLDAKWEFKRNIRPWSRSLYVGVVKDFLAPGDTITIRFGDRRQGSPGIRLQTYGESEFEFRVFADPIATYDYVALPESPKIAIVPGPGVRWRAVLPSLVRAGEPFRLSIKADDKWGNPSNLNDRTLRLVSDRAIAGLPSTLRFAAGQLRGHGGRPAPGGARRLHRARARRGHRTVPLEPAAHRPQGHAAGALLGRHARPVERDARHQHGARILRVRPRQGLPRRDGPPGQRLPDHRRLLARAEPTVGRVRQAGPLRVHPRLRVVGQHRGRRRPQRALPPRGRDHPPLLARPDRRCHRHRRRGHRRARRPRAVRQAAGQGLRGDGARRRTLRRHQVRPRPAGDGGRGALGLGHVRVDRARRLREELPRRHRRQLGRPQGPARRLLSRRLVLRQLRRADLLPGRAPGSRRHLRMHAPAPALRDHRQPRAARCDGHHGIAGRAVPARSCCRSDDFRERRSA